MQAPRFGLCPPSLAATNGVSVDFLSSRYLDVSVPWVGLHGLCIHPWMTPSGCPVTPGFPIRRSPDQSLLDSSPRHIAAYHVLHRLSTPRHPPCTLHSLTTFMRGCHARPARRRTTQASITTCQAALYQRFVRYHVLEIDPNHPRANEHEKHRVDSKIHDSILFHTLIRQTHRR